MQSYTVHESKNKGSFIMWYRVSLTSFVQNYLPPKAELITSEKPYKKPAIFMSDLDGDGIQEIIAAYRWLHENYIIIMKNYNNIWYVMANIKGKGYGLNYLNTVPITRGGINNLVIGWQVGANLGLLNIYEWTAKGIKNILKENMYYNKIEVEDIEGKKYRDGKAEIALRRHVTGETYEVEVYRWHDGKLEPDLDVYSGKDISKIKNRYEKLYLASLNTANGLKYGYINDKGDFIIKPMYDFAYDFQDNGLAIVQEKSLFGIIDPSGKYVVKPRYGSIEQFSEGRAVVADNDVFKVIDEKGKELTTKPYSFIGRFKEGRATTSATEQQGKELYGYLDRGGKEIVPPKYESAGDYNNGKAVVKVKDNQYALIGLNGQMLKNYNYAFVGDFGDGLLAFKQSDEGKFGYIDQNGTIVIPPKYTGAQPFSNGKAIVNISETFSNGYGLIDKKGNYVIQPKYNDINMLDDNRIAVGRAIDKNKPYIGSKYAIADTDGKFLTDFIYNQVSNYKDGYASTFNDKYTFFIDKAGNAAKNLPVVSGSGTLSLQGDLIKADVDHRLSYLDKAGNIVWKQNTIIPLNNQYSVKEEKYKPNKDYLVYYPQIQGMKDINAQNSVNNKLKELSQVKRIDGNIQLDYNYLGDFAIELFKKKLLVIELSGYEYHLGAAHGMPTQIYAHVDLESGRLYELKDLFKKNSNYVKVLSDIIEKQIKTNPEYSYVWLDSYKGIKEDQPFYVGEDALYIYFNPYDIAPYSAGFPTFKIPFKDIISIIDTNGEFWRAFN